MSVFKMMVELYSNIEMGKMPNRATVPKRVRRMNYDKLLNSWVDAMTTHDMTEITQLSKKIRRP